MSTSLVRKIVHPFAELVLGVRDTFSPEMKEIRERSLAAQVREQGRWYVVRRSAVLTSGFVAFNVAIGIGAVASGKHTWGWLLGEASLIRWAITGGVCFLFCLMLTAIGTERLRKRYPEEFSNDATA